MFSDASNTLILVVTLLASEEFNFSIGIKAGLVKLSPLFNMVGILIFWGIQAKTKIRPKKMLVVSLIGFLGLAVYGILGVFTNLPIGLRSSNVFPLSGCTAL